MIRKIKHTDTTQCFLDYPFCGLSVQFFNLLSICFVKLNTITINNIQIIFNKIINYTCINIIWKIMCINTKSQYSRNKLFQRVQENIKFGPFIFFTYPLSSINPDKWEYTPYIYKHIFFHKIKQTELNQERFSCTMC